MVSDELRKSFVRCESPRFILNKYTHEKIKVNCGQCPACLLAKSSSKSMKCEIQQSLSKYCYFITLTYATHYLPKAKINLVADIDPSNPEIIDCENWNRYHEFESIPRKYNKKFDFHDDEIIRFRFDSTRSYIANLKDKVDLTANGVYPQYKGLVSYLNYADYQYFQKRLRKKIYTIIGKYEKIYTYVVGEYGPVHFRPHFHLLLFFDSQQLSENISRIVRSSWVYGRVDTEFARSHASSYVASYVNSTSVLPYIYRSYKKISIFSRFSNYFAQSRFEEVFKNSSERKSKFLNGTECLVNGVYKTIHPWRSVLDRFYPRFGSLNVSNVFEIQRLIQSISKIDHYLARHGYLDEYSLMDKSRILFNLMCDKYGKYYMPNWLSLIRVHSRCTRLLISGDKERGISSIYRLLTQYYNFCNNWLGVSYYASYLYGVSLSSLIEIAEFYSALDFQNLRHQYELQIEYFSNPLTMYEPNSLDMFYDLSDSSKFDVGPVISQSKNSLYLNNRSVTYIRYQNSMKHKKLNDGNRIFADDH